jgi:hypothetical protein
MHNLPKSKLVKSQTKKFRIEGIVDEKEFGSKRAVNMEIVIRYDDQCGNGHNSFSITGTIGYGSLNRHQDIISGGCIHDSIAKYAPEYKQLIKWHLTSSDEPMHYVSNTMYHVSDKDYDGLKEGEYKAFKKEVRIKPTKDGTDVTVYKTGQLYSNKRKNENLQKSNKKEALKLNAFINNLDVKYTIVEVFEDWAKSEGKKVELEHARSSAVWPEATIEQLSDKTQLLERLPALMHEFKKDMKNLGFNY